MAERDEGRARPLNEHPRNDASGRVPAGVRCACHDETGTLRRPCPYAACVVNPDGS